MVVKKRGRGRGSTAEKVARRLSTVQAKIWRFRKALQAGRVLYYDPSCHSAGNHGNDVGGTGSQPGWCLYVEGKYVESGVINLENPDIPTQDRLHEICRILREEMAAKGPFDVIVHEDPPLKRWIPCGNRGPGAGKVKVYGSVAAQLPLHYAVAALFCALRSPRWLKIQPQVWRQFMPEGYEKSDEGDAVMLGIATMSLLAREQHAREARKLGSVRRARIGVGGKTARGKS